MFLTINSDKWKELKKQSFSEYYIGTLIKISLFFIFIAAFFNITTDKKHNLNITIGQHLIYDLVIPIVLAAILSYVNCKIEIKLNSMLYSNEVINKKLFKRLYLIDNIVWIGIIVNLISILSLANIYNKSINELVLDVIAGIIVGIIMGLFSGFAVFKKFQKKYLNDFEKAAYVKNKNYKSKENKK